MVWYETYRWTSNPFLAKPMSDIISGFDDVRSELLEFIKSGNCCLLTGPPGSGKTTLLKWLEKYGLSEVDPIYINTSGMVEEELKRINIDKMVRDETGIMDKLLKKEQEIVILIDEAETLPSTIGEAIERNFDNHKIKAIVLASVTDNVQNLKDNLLERIGDRKIVLRPLSKDEARDMIDKRISYSNPFEPGVLDLIFEKAGYNPKKILELCESLARENQGEIITLSFANKHFSDKETKEHTLDFLDKLSPLQRKIVNILMTGNYRPKEIARKLAKPTKTITSQLAYLGLKSRIDLMIRKGVDIPIVEKVSDNDSIYKLTDEIKKSLGIE